MISEQMGEFRGKIISRRRLPEDDLGPREEVILEENGQLLSLNVKNILTAVTATRPGGNLYLEGRLTMVTSDGDIAAGNALGTAKPGDNGGLGSLRCAVHFDTASRQLGWVKNMIAYWETEQDQDGKTRGKLWRWGLRPHGPQLPPEDWPVFAAVPGSTSIN